MDKELKALIKFLEDLLLQLDKPSQEATNYIIEQALNTLDNLTVQDSKLVFDNTALNELVKLETKLNNYLNNSSYSNSVKDLLTGFDSISNRLQKIHKFNGVDNVNDIASPIKKAFVQQAQELLLNNGIKYEVIQPLKALITQQALTGQSISKVKKTIDGLKNNGITIGTNKVQNLQNYSTQIARDIVYGYQGAINKKVAEEYGLNGFIYQGGLVTDSRPICSKLVKKERFDKEYLKSALANTPKDGMIPNTNVDNFAVYRGGYNCRHVAIPVRVDNLETTNNASSQNAEKIASSKVKYDSYNKNWNKVYFDEETGGYVVAHKNHVANKNVKDGEKELKNNIEIGKAFASNGKKVELIKSEYNKFGLDAKVDGEFYEFTATESNSVNTLQKNIRKGYEQIDLFYKQDRLTSEKYNYALLLNSNIGNDSISNAIRLVNIHGFKLDSLTLIKRNKIITISKSDVENGSYNYLLKK